MRKENAKAVKSIERLLLLDGMAVSIAIILFSAFRIISANSSIDIEEPPQLWTATFLPDGKTLAVVGGRGNPFETPRRGELVLWDLESHTMKFLLRQKSSVRCVASSPDGHLLAIGEFSGSTKLINATTGAIIDSQDTQTGVNTVVFSPDGKLVASGRLDGTIALWNLASKAHTTLALPGETVLNIAISSANQWSVATTRSGKVYVFNLAHPGSPQVLKVYSGPPIDEPNVEAVAFSPDGRSFATGCQKCLRLWECSTGRLIRDLAGSVANINSAAFSPNGRSLATVDSDGTLALWDPASGECLRTIKAHSGTSFSVTFSPDGKSIATIGRDDFTAKIWDANSLTLLTTLQRKNVSTLPR